MNNFIDMIRPVRVGIVLGLATIVFGMLWVMFIKTQHEFLHKVMAEVNIEIPSEGLSLAGLSIVPTAHASGTGSHSHGEETMAKKAGTDSHHGSTDTQINNKDNHNDNMPAETSMVMSGSGESHGGPDHHAKGGEDLEALAHKRLVRGHIHAMGIGLLVILVSLMLSATIATEKVKYITSTCLGIGGFFYPFTWIIMGLFTQSFGAAQAEQSVMILVGPTVLLILGSVMTTLYFTYKTLFTQQEG